MRKLLTLLFAVVITTMSARAYHFMVDGLCYNKNSDGTSVTVTYQNSSSPRYSNLSGGLTIPESVTYSGKTYSVTSIGERAFSGCTGLTSVTIPNSVTSIGGSAFYYCTGLTSVTIPNSVTSIGEGAFYYCTGLTSVTIPNSVTAIGVAAFRDCSGMTSVTIPNSVTSIGNYAFYGCTGLTSVTIPNSVTSIGVDAFSGCRGLTTIIVDSGNTIYDSRNNCNAIIKTETNTLVTGCKNTVIPNSVTSIGDVAFYFCTGLTSVTIPNSVTSIGQDAFACCYGLTSVSIGNSVTTIGYRAFDKCTSLTSVTIPGSVTTIGSNAFRDCSGLTSVTIPNSVTSIGVAAFSGCRGLTTIIVDSGNTIYDSRNNCNAIIETETNTLVTGCKNTVIPNSVTSIGNYAFSGCSGLTTIIIPNSVTSIGNYAFSGCTGLTSVTIPNSVTSIGGSAFYYCTGLTSVTIPNSVTSIGERAFSGCTGLTSVTIPNSVTSIGGSAFYYCTGLTSVTIPNSVTSIGEGAFYYCTGLTSVTIPNSVTSIGDNAFYGCTGLEYVICLPTTPPSGAKGMFPIGMTIYVPASSLNTYKSSSYWRLYNIYPIGEPSCNPSYTSIKIYGPFITLNSATVNGKNYYPENGEIIVEGLMPGTNYQVTVSYTVEDEGNKSMVFDVTTKALSFSPSFNITQTSVTPRFTVTRDAGFIPEKCGVTFNGTNYNGNITESTDGYHRIECPKISGLSLNTNYNIELWVEFKGTKYSSNATFKTSAIGISTNKAVGPTSANITATYTAGDAVVQDSYFTFGGQNYDKQLIVTGLKPQASYSTTYTVVTKNGSQSQGIDFTTPSLTMVAQPARMLSNTSPLLMATTNIADEETGCGFEWRRYDAPAEMPSTKVFSPVAGGMIMGVVKNMTENVYYKYRPFYRASDGTEYYGDWMAFLTADAGVYYEPVAYTYAQCLVEGNSATVNGMAMPGSENINSQGFAYWLNTSAHAPATEMKSVPANGVTLVTASGQRMSATLTDLQRGKTYSYCAFVKTDSGTFYGEERTFSTEGLPGDVNGDGNITAADVTALYDFMLNNDTTHLVNGDQNGDGEITAADVTAVYGVLLGN